MKTQITGFPLPFGDSQYRLSLAGDGEHIQVERHGVPYRMMTWEDAKRWVAESREAWARERAGAKAHLRAIVRSRHCSRSQAMTELRASGFVDPEFRLI